MLPKWLPPALIAVLLCGAVFVLLSEDHAYEPISVIALEPAHEQRDLHQPLSEREREQEQDLRQPEPDTDVKVLRPPHALQTPLVRSECNLSLYRSRMGFDHVYVLNLKRRPERLHSFIDFVEHCQLDVQYCWGVDGLELHNNDTDVVSFCAPANCSTTDRGRIANAMGHVAIWRDMLERGFQAVAVLEDDARVFPPMCAAAEELWEENGGMEWDYLGFKQAGIPGMSGFDKTWEGYADLEKKWNAIAPLHVVRVASGVVRVGSFWNTHSYAISRSGAKKLLKNFGEVGLLHKVMDVQVNGFAIENYVNGHFVALQLRPGMSDSNFTQGVRDVLVPSTKAVHG